MVLETIKTFISKPINAILTRVDETHEKIFWNIVLILIMTVLNYIVFNFADKKKDGMNIGDAFYYTMTTHFTIGFGDISPIGPWSRLIYYFHIVLVWFINMVPAGLTVFDEIRKNTREAYPKTKTLTKQAKFSSMTELPKGNTPNGLAGTK